MDEWLLKVTVFYHLIRMAYVLQKTAIIVGVVERMLTCSVTLLRAGEKSLLSIK